jgi:nitrogen fixation-related uncharacterized protein
MLIGILAVVTFLLLVAVAVFLAAVSSKQYEMSKVNKRGIRDLRKEDLWLRSKVDHEVRRLDDSQLRSDEDHARKREEDAREFTTRSLKLANSVQAGSSRPRLDQGKNGRAPNSALHLTDVHLDRYAPLAAGKVWSSKGVVLDDQACLEMGGGGGKNGQICLGKVSEGMDIIGKESEKRTGGGRPPSSGSKDASDWEADLRKVYVHDFLDAKAFDTGYLRVKGGDSEEHNPDGKPTIFASKTDGRNYLRGDTSVKGDLGVAGALRVRGGDSKLNPDDKKTMFSNPENSYKNDIRGDTTVSGHLTGAGDLRVEGAARFTGANTTVPLDDDGKHKHTSFNDPDSKGNVIRGDTQVSGDMTHLGEVRAKNGVNVSGGELRAKSLLSKKARFANDTDKNNIVMDGGKTSDGKNEGLSALNFNGDTDDGDNNFDAAKMRWRIGVDQRVDKDAMFIDRFGGGKTWKPITIEDGRIKINGEVQVCDEEGDNCRTV